MIRLFSKESGKHTESLITPQNKNLFWAFGLVAGSWSICLLIMGTLTIVSRKLPGQPAADAKPPAVKQFASETEFRNYFTQSQTRSFGVVDMALGTGPSMMKSFSTPAELATPAADDAATRVSETNVQIKGIDEPDIVKTDGKQLYISDEQRFYMQPMVKPMIAPSVGIGMPAIVPPQPVNQPKTQIIQALPVSALKKLGTVDKLGDLLLSGNILMVFGSQSITGYDVSQVDVPRQIWEYTLSDNRQITASRLVNGKVILVTQLNVYSSIPCPLPLFKEGSATPTIACTTIWRPAVPINADSAYTVLQLNPDDGQIEHQVSFAGANGQTVVSVSTHAVYVTFTNTADWGKLTAQFLLDPANTLVSADVKDHLKKVLAMDISDQAKQVEVDHIVNQFASTMSDDDRMKWEADRNNQMTAYVDQHKRELEKTEIAKVPLSDFTVAALGEVPGHPLNQFSIDEYDNHVRIATSVGGRGLGGGAESANDVYVLDSNLKTVGSVTDLGKKERIYAVRFMGNRGYVVTFKETDPLFVLDLSQASAPKVTGELQLPGYSSYLHPLKDNLLAGIGKEENQVKATLFDVSDSTNPKEVATYRLPDYWSAIQSTHHAFLQDADHEVFFLPAEKGGYIFSYAGNDLKLAKTVEGNGINRALYINDFMYLVGSGKVTVLSEKDWSAAKTIEW